MLDKIINKFLLTEEETKKILENNKISFSQKLFYHNDILYSYIIRKDKKNKIEYILVENKKHLFKSNNLNIIKNKIKNILEV